MSQNSEFGLNWENELALRKSIIVSVFSTFKNRKFSSETHRTISIKPSLSDIHNENSINNIDESTFFDILQSDESKLQYIYFFFISIDQHEYLLIKPTYWDVDLLAGKYTEWVQQKRKALSTVQDSLTKKNMQIRLSLTNTAKLILLSCFRPPIRERFKDHEQIFTA